MVITFSYDLKMLDAKLNRADFERIIFDEINKYSNCKPLSTYYLIDVKSRNKRSEFNKAMLEFGKVLENNKAAKFRYIIQESHYLDLGYYLDTSDVKCVKGLFDINY